MARDALEETRELLRRRMSPFRRRVRKVGDCLVWLGAKAGRYGYVWSAGKVQCVHRVVYRYFNGDTIPEGWHVDHICNNPLCVNPAHLQTLPPHMNITREHALLGHRMCPHPDPERYVWGGCKPCHREYNRKRYYRLKETQK